ncbi:MAG TPA: L-lysine 6-transaminase [Egibacteraceae bacterium]|nr:L-lysine 6-transaminase [Egibacteraceae bacterium]
MVAAADVHEILRRHLLVDGYEFVLDTAASRGSWLVDARDGSRYLDLFTFYASAPLGINHPALADDRRFLGELARVAVNKPSNSDVYSTELAEFVETFAQVLGDPALPHLFFVEGGAAAVENALKTAFDWKSRHNVAHGRHPELGTQVLHLTQAFHGRGGYTLSVTNTDPVKTERFPTFDWPRIDVPAVVFPLEQHRAQVQAAEERALAQARAAFAAHRNDIACFLAEPIQGESGDNHLRGEFLQAMQALCRQHDALLVLDEVQTGGGTTGTPWAYQQLGIEPDVVAFGKKLQVCGIMAGGKVDEVADNVFAVSSRLNSTWGGNLTDMVRARRILQVVEREGLIERAATLGKRLVDGLLDVAGAHPGLVSNVRGRGLMCAVDLPSAGLRDRVVAGLRDDERVLALPGGRRALRFRPALTISEDELALACAALDRVLGRLQP